MCCASLAHQTLSRAGRGGGEGGECVVLVSRTRLYQGRGEEEVVNMLC